MIFGTIGYDGDGAEMIDRIYLKYPETLTNELIVCTESEAPCTWIDGDDWHPYNGERIADETYYLIDDKYYPSSAEEVDDLIDDWDKVQSFDRIDTYSKGKLIKTEYK